MAVRVHDSSYLTADQIILYRPDEYVDTASTPANPSNHAPPASTASTTEMTERVPLKRGASVARRTYDRTKVCTIRKMQDEGQMMKAIILTLIVSISF